MIFITEISSAIEEESEHKLEILISFFLAHNSEH